MALKTQQASRAVCYAVELVSVEFIGSTAGVIQEVTSPDAFLTYISALYISNVIFFLRKMFG